MNWTLLLTVVPILHQTLGLVMVGKNRERVGDTEGKIIYFTGVAILVITGFFVLAFIESKTDPVFWTLGLIAALLYQALMERIYLNDPKYYITSLLTLAVSLLYIQFFVL